MIRKALLKLVTLAGQKLQGSLNGRTKECQNLQPYGIFSSPPSNSEIVMLPYYDSYYGIPYKKDIIPSLQQNEFVCGNFVIGSLIKFDKDGNIDITIKNDCNINITGDCNITCVNANINATNINLNGETIINSGAYEVVTQNTTITDSIGGACVIGIGTSSDLKTT